MFIIERFAHSIFALILKFIIILIIFINPSIKAASKIEERNKLQAYFLEKRNIHIQTFDEKDSLFSLFEQILQKDNIIIDSLLNQDLQTTLLLSQKHNEEISLLEKKHKKSIINSVFLICLLLISFVVIFLLLKSKRSLKKLNDDLTEQRKTLQKEFDKHVQIWSQEIEARDAIVLQMKELIKRLENTIVIKQKEQDDMVVIENATIAKLQAEIQILKTTLAESKDREAEYQDRINNLLYYKKRIPELETQNKELRDMMEADKVYFETKLTEKEQTLRTEIKILKTKISMQEDAILETETLREKIAALSKQNEHFIFEKDTYFSLMEGYKTSLENEVQARKEIEKMLKEILNKRK